MIVTLKASSTFLAQRETLEKEWSANLIRDPRLPTLAQSPESIERFARSFIGVFLEAAKAHSLEDAVSTPSFGTWLDAFVKGSPPALPVEEGSLFVLSFKDVAFPVVLAAFADDVAGATRNAVDLFKLLDALAIKTIQVLSGSLTGARDELIAAQAAAIRELSTPILQLWDRLLLLPIIGVLDSRRAYQLTTQLLAAIRDRRAKVIVLDVTGVPMMDSRVAHHLIQTADACRLMGAEVILTGLSAEVAQALVSLGVDLGRLTTAGDLQEGLEQAERLLSELAVAR